MKQKKGNWLNNSCASIAKWDSMNSIVRKRVHIENIEKLNNENIIEINMKKEKDTMRNFKENMNNLKGSMIIR